MKVVGGLDDAFQQQTQLQKSFLPISGAHSSVASSDLKCLMIIMLLLFFQISKYYWTQKCEQNTVCDISDEMKNELLKKCIFSHTQNSFSLLIDATTASVCLFLISSVGRSAFEDYSPLKYGEWFDPFRPFQP